MSQTVGMTNKVRGFALFMTLMISGILVMLVTVTLFSARGGSVFTNDYHAKRAAYLAAESGLALLQKEFEANPDYDSTFADDTPFGTGRYSYTFGSDGCINNLQGATSVPGPYGDIPAGSAYIKIQGEAQGHVETIECLLGRKDSDFITSAVVASGKMFFDGNITVTGEQSHDRLSKIPADIISNFTQDFGSGREPLFYDRASAVALIEGTVRSANPSESAISADLKDAANGKAFTNQAPVPLKNYDIQAEVDSKASLPSPPSSGGIVSGDYHTSGNYTVPGDLVLADGNLYIDGDLTVIGSITGRGSVYVTGNTVFSGDAMVASKDDGVALYGLKNVSLTGFNGSQYMDALTASAGGDNPVLWQQAKSNLGLISEYLKSSDTSHLRVNSSNPDAFWGSDVGRLINITSNKAYLPSSPHPTLPPSQVRTNMLWHLSNLVEADNAARNTDGGKFMLKKFRALRSGPERGVDSGPNINGAMGINYSRNPDHVRNGIRQFLDNGELTDGVFYHTVWIKVSRLEGDTTRWPDISDQDIDLALRKMANWLDNYDYDKLGSSYFKGAVYTRGALYAANEVTIIGSVAVVADPDTADSEPDFEPVSGVSLRPGDLYLANGTNVTFVADLAPGTEPTLARVGVSTWLR